MVSWAGVVMQLALRLNFWTSPSLGRAMATQMGEARALLKQCHQCGKTSVLPMRFLTMFPVFRFGGCVVPRERHSLN